MPVAVTTISARPRTTVVFMNTAPCAVAEGRCRRVGAREAASLSTGTDSPVSDDSSTERLAATTQPAVGGHPVAGLEQHDVAGDELVGGDLR